MTCLQRRIFASYDLDHSPMTFNVNTSKVFRVINVYAIRTFNSYTVITTTASQQAMHISKLSIMQTLFSRL